MSISSELKAVNVLLNGLEKDVDEWERNGCPAWCGCGRKRVNATQCGIRERITVIRKMLLQIERDMIEKIR